MIDAPSNRRRFLAATLGAAAAFAGGGLLRTAGAQSALREIELRDDLKLVTGMGSNALVLRAARGWKQPSDHAPVFATFDL